MSRFSAIRTILIFLADFCVISIFIAKVTSVNFITDLIL